MERSENNYGAPDGTHPLQQSEFRKNFDIAYECGYQAAIRDAEAKARYDRYVCASMAWQGGGGMTPDYEVIADDALKLMLAADKRWEEYTKGGQDE